MCARSLPSTPIPANTSGTFQTVPEDSWDFDSVQQLTLADIRINGQTRKVIMQANKSGFFLVLDRLTGKIISGDRLPRSIGPADTI